MVQVCCHVYVLPPPSGPESIGVCKLCGVTKIHLNSGNDRGSVWEAWEGKESERKGMERVERK